MSGEEGFEEWDADFLDQLIQVEELALSSKPAPPPCYYPSSSHLDVSHSPYESHSPPPLLSQRLIPDAPHEDPRDLQLQRLKGELQLVSKQLRYLEQECLELRKERDEKEEKLKNVYSQIEAKGAEIHCLKSRNLENGVSQKCQNVNTSMNQADFQGDEASCKSKGVQTDMAHSTTCARDHLSDKLLTIWGSQSVQTSGKNLVAKLLVVCETDFHVLFGFLSTNMASKMVNSLTDEDCSDLALKGLIMSSHSSEAEKVSHLYSVLTKVSNEIVQLEVLFKALIDLCGVGNAIIVHRSLCILHAVLNHLPGLGWKSEKSLVRDNIIVEDLCFRDSIADSHGPKSAQSAGLVCVREDEIFYPADNAVGARVFQTEVPQKKEHLENSTAWLVASINWGSLFELMHEIAMRSTEECIILEAVSIMNVIIMRSNAYQEREKFGTQAFSCVSQLLRKETGFCVRKEAMHLLYLLLNCPNLLVAFCSGCEDGIKGAEDENHDASYASAFREFNIILDGLANCVSCRGNGVRLEFANLKLENFGGTSTVVSELQLHRSAITVVAFLASGKSGFEILLGHKLSKQTNFLVLILQLLVSEMDVEAGELTERPEISKERTLLIREALIFLNRLVCNPAYSTAVLQVLTSSREMVSLTMDIGNRVFQGGRRRMRESEIVDLAQAFRKRVFSYLGDRLS